jgi:leader peptidase (prepilin peptidase)/N-methyltransferase
MSALSSGMVGASVGGLGALGAAPGLARVSLAAAARADLRWWRGVRGSRPTRRRLGIVAIVAAALGVLGGYAAGWSAALPAFVSLALVATPLAIVDAEHQRLPDRLVLPGALAAIFLLAAAAALRADWAALLRAIEAAGLVFAVFFLIATTSPSSMGFGDVKLAGLIGGYLGWLGWAAVLYGIFAGFVLGALFSVLLLATGRASLKTSIPLGPALIAGALLVASAHTAF